MPMSLRLRGFARTGLGDVDCDCQPLTQRKRGLVAKLHAIADAAGPCIVDEPTREARPLGVEGDLKGGDERSAPLCEIRGELKNARNTHGIVGFVVCAQIRCDARDISRRRRKGRAAIAAIHL